MPYIELADSKPSNVKIMIFAEGTILKPKSLLSLYDHRSYIPIGNAVSLIENWQGQSFTTGQKSSNTKTLLKV